MNSKTSLSDAEIFQLFKGSCVVCWKPATELNHIVLRSRVKSLIDDWKNKVPMCSLCHEQYHSGGTTKYKVMQLQLARKNFLISIDKKEYI